MRAWLVALASLLAVAGLMLATGSSASETTTYTYDTNGRLIQSAHSGTVNNGLGTSYTLDPADNRTNVSATTSALPPVANNVTATVAYNSTNTAISLNITGVAASSVAVSTQAAHGTATASGTSITYTPANGYSGSDSFQYTATNNWGTSAPATVSITVDPQAPVANNISATVAYGSTSDAISLNITGGTAASVAVSAQAGHGTATASGTSITYTPASGYSGSDSFQYTATNAGGTSPAATVSITVTPPPPVANNSSATVAYNSTNNSITLSITGGTPSSVMISSQAGHGTATASGTSITYTPTSGYSGPDSFQYTASNAGGTSAAGSVSITVNPQAPSAQSTAFSVGYNTTNNAENGIFYGGVPTSVAVVTQPSHGTVTATGTTFYYTPASGYSGWDSFQYTGSNAGGTSAPATFTVSVLAAPPVASNINDTVAYNSNNNQLPLNFTYGGAPTSVAITFAPANGTATVSGTSIYYTPNSGFVGSDQINYTGTNAAGTSAAAFIGITVNPPPPVANAVGVTVTENSSSSLIPLSTAGTVTSVAVSSQPSHGSASASGATISYTPASGYAGTDSFTYTATNPGGTSSPATVSVTVSPLGPTAVPVSMTLHGTCANGVCGAGGCVNAIASDISPNGYPLTITSVGPPSISFPGPQDSVQNNEACYQILEAPNTTVSFDYTISDGQGGTSTSTVTVNLIYP